VTGGGGQSLPGSPVCFLCHHLELTKARDEPWEQGTVGAWSGIPLTTAKHYMLEEEVSEEP
jgi:hypothetical protein